MAVLHCLFVVNKGLLLFIDHNPAVQAPWLKYGLREESKTASMSSSKGQIQLDRPYKAFGAGR